MLIECLKRYLEKEKHLEVMGSKLSKFCVITKLFCIHLVHIAWYKRYFIRERDWSLQVL